MPITVRDFPSLTDDLQSIYNEVAKAKVADMKGNKVFNVFDTNRRTFDHLILHGMSGIKEVTPGQDLPNITSEEGDSITWTQRYFGGIASITKEMRLFDLHNQMETVIKSIATDAFDKIDQSLADVLLYGWATTYTDVFGKSVTATGPDAVALFSASHSNNFNATVFSNIITDATVNPVLSRSAIVAAIKQGLTHKDPNGMIRPINLDTIVVAPSNADLVERILLSSQMSGNAQNDINPLKGKVSRIIVWERLETRSDTTDTSAFWFMFDSSKVGETLNCLFAERPSLDAPDQVYSNKNWEYSCDFFYTIGLGYPAFIFGSNATGA
jgi:hypothetical protein